MIKKGTVLMCVNKEGWSSQDLTEGHLYVVQDDVRVISGVFTMIPIGRELDHIRRYSLNHFKIVVEP
jgi:hypothetical protein